MLFPAVWTVLLFTVALIHSSLSAAVLMKRQSGFGEHKPQIWSGPYPCFDKDGKMKFPPPKDPPWFTDDKCHMSICAGAMVITKSLCVLKGIVCPPGSYLAVPPKPTVASANHTSRLNDINAELELT